MEFWGVELKGDKPVKVEPAVDEVVHLSQATIADLKKGSEPVMLYAKVGNQKLVIGVLNAEKYPQLSFDLVFEKEFELSHNSKNGSVHLTGYKSIIPEDEEELDLDSSDEEEAIPIEEKQNGAVAAPALAKAKPAAPAAKKDNKAKEESSEDDDSDSDDEDDESDDGDESDEVMAVAGEDDDSDEDESDEEETPVKSAGGKKRPAAASKTLEAKKVKLVTPQKTEGGKSVGGHVATPHPAKNAKSPKSGGQVSCGPCKKTFNSQSALDSHSKAKHSAK